MEETKTLLTVSKSWGIKSVHFDREVELATLNAYDIEKICGKHCNITKKEAAHESLGC